MGPDIEGRHVQYRVVHIHGEYLRRGQVNGQVDGDGPAAGADVGDGQFGRFHAHQRHEQGMLHQALGLGARYQHRRRDHHADAVELALAQDVGQRFPIKAALQERVESALLLRGNLGLLLGEDVLPGHAHHIHHQHLGFQAGVGYAGGFQFPVGILNDATEYGHGQLSILMG